MSFRQTMQGQTRPPRAFIRDMFSAIAPTYDSLNHLLSLSIDRSWRTFAVRRVCEVLTEAHSIKSGKSRENDVPRRDPLRILDIATGTGDLALTFARELRGNARIIGVDFARPMIDIALKKTEKARLNNQVHFAAADALQLPFSDGYFSVAAIAFGLRNTENPEQALREMIRVIQPDGGVVMILEFIRPYNPVFRWLYDLYFMNILPRIGGWISRSTAYHYLPQSVVDFWGMKETRRRLKKLGLQRVSSWQLSGGIAGLHLAQRGDMM